MGIVTNYPLQEFLPKTGFLPKTIFWSKNGKTWPRDRQSKTAQTAKSG